MSNGERRRERLRRAHLYLVIDAEVDGRPADAVVEAALRGGVDLVQLREKERADEEIVAAGRRLRALCDEHDALLVVNDRPDLALACDADAVHVGQEDEAIAGVRRTVGDELLIGVSTHSPDQVAAALEADVDYFAVGPVHATPTKPGRPAVGLELVRHAAEVAGERPFFAIGGIDTGNVADVAAAGAERVAVVRAIRDADDPRAVAAQLRAALVPAHV
ncbi:MAG TPA: thiamine phosphate synthase [Thermoleophilaceae bacterium]|nr:thiamine phosphate synthase [Thermoleophilaceae bacterium]